MRPNPIKVSLVVTRFCIPLYCPSCSKLQPRFEQIARLMFSSVCSHSIATAQATVQANSCSNTGGVRPARRRLRRMLPCGCNRDCEHTVYCQLILYSCVFICLLAYHQPQAAAQFASGQPMFNASVFQNPYPQQQQYGGYAPPAGAYGGGYAPPAGSAYGGGGYGQYGAQQQQQQQQPLPAYYQQAGAGYGAGEYVPPSGVSACLYDDTSLRVLFYLNLLPR